MGELSWHHEWRSPGVFDIKWDSNLTSIHNLVSCTKVFGELLPLSISTIWALESKTLEDSWSLVLYLCWRLSSELNFLTLSPTCIGSRSILTNWPGQRLALLERVFDIHRFVGICTQLAVCKLAISLTVAWKIFVKLFLKALASPTCGRLNTLLASLIWIWNDNLSFLRTYQTVNSHVVICCPWLETVLGKILIVMVDGSICLRTISDATV